MVPHGYVGHWISHLFVRTKVAKSWGVGNISGDPVAGGASPGAGATFRPPPATTARLRPRHYGARWRSVVLPPLAEHATPRQRAS